MAYDSLDRVYRFHNISEEFESLWVEEYCTVVNDRSNKFKVYFEVTPSISLPPNIMYWIIKVLLSQIQTDWHGYQKSFEETHLYLYYLINAIHDYNLI